MPMGIFIRAGYALVFVVTVVGTVLSPNLFGLSDGAWLLLLVSEFVGGLIVGSVLMAVLPRRFQPQAAGAQPTSATLRRRVDGMLVALRIMPKRSEQADIAALRQGITLYARAVRTDGTRPLLGMLLLDAPANGSGVIRWRQGTQNPQTINAPYTLAERTDSPGAVARRLRATKTVRVGASAVFQVTPMDLTVLHHVAAAAQGNQSAALGAGDSGFITQ